MHEKVDHLPTQNLKYKQTSGTSNNKIKIPILLSSFLLQILFNIFLSFEVISVKCYSTSKQKYVAQ